MRQIRKFDKEAKKHQESHIKKLRSREKPQEFEIEGIKITVNPDVFGPASDTILLAKYIKVKKGNKVLDLTTGSGIIAAVAAIQGAEVTAVDILDEAIHNANQNFKKLNLKVQTIQSDMFENVPAGKFDYIYANGPYFEGKIKDPLEYASLDVSNFLEKLFSKLERYLLPTGMLLITFAEFGEIETFYNKLEKYGFSYQKIDSRTSSDGKRIYSLFKVIPNKKAMPTNKIKTNTEKLHSIPKNLQTLLNSSPEILEKWDTLTPLAQNEWICWLTIPKKQETKDNHLKRLADEIFKGKQRPCCFAGCPHRNPNANKWY